MEPTTLWPKQIEANATEASNIEDLAKIVGISLDLAVGLLEGLLETEQVSYRIVPRCSVTLFALGMYEEEELPDSFQCPFCREEHGLEGIPVSFQYKFN